MITVHSKIRGDISWSVTYDATTDAYSILKVRLNEFHPAEQLVSDAYIHEILDWCRREQIQEDYSDTWDWESEEIVWDVDLDDPTIYLDGCDCTWMLSESDQEAIYDQAHSLDLWYNG
jgi:hypothetical protein